MWRHCPKSSAATNCQCNIPCLLHGINHLHLNFIQTSKFIHCQFTFYRIKCFICTLCFRKQFWIFRKCIEVTTFCLFKKFDILIH